MLPVADSYAELTAHFQWDIPEFYNIGVDVCDKWAEVEPARLALIHVTEGGATEEYTFADIRRLSNQTANLLASQGIETGDRVALLLPQAPETAYSHVAVYKLGAIALPLFTLFGTDALAYRLRDSGAKAVITNADGAAKLAGLRNDLPDLTLVFVIDNPPSGCLDFHGLRQKQPAQIG